MSLRSPAGKAPRTPTPSGRRAARRSFRARLPRRRRTRCAPRTASGLTPMGSGGFRLRRRHRRAEPRPWPSRRGEANQGGPGHGRDPHLLPGDAVRELRRTRGAAECPRPRPLPRRRSSSVRRGSGGERRQDRALPHRALGDHRLRRRLSRSHARLHRPHRKMRPTRRASDRCSGGLPSALPESLPRHNRGGLPRVARAAVQGGMDPARVAAIIIEPVLGEGGFHAAPAEFMRRLRSICDSHGIVLIAMRSSPASAAPDACSRSRRHRKGARAGPDHDRQERGRRRAALRPHRQGRHHGRPGSRAASGAPTPATPSGVQPRLAVLEVIERRAALRRARGDRALHEFAPEGPAGSLSLPRQIRGLGGMVATGELVKDRNADAARPCRS